MNDGPSTNDATEKAQSKKIVEQSEPSTCSGSKVDTQRSNDNENDSLDDAPSKQIVKKKYRNFLDSDSEEEDDIVSSILGKSKRSQEMQSDPDHPDENLVETLHTNAAKSKSVGRLIDSDSNDSDVVDEPENAGMNDDADNSVYTVRKRVCTFILCLRWSFSFSVVRIDRNAFSVVLTDQRIGGL